MQFTVEKTKEFYYHDDGDDRDDGHSVGSAGKRATVRASKKADRHSQTETLEKAGDSEVVDILDVVVGLWAHNATKDMRRARMMEEEQTRESIRKWLQFVP